MKYNLCGWNDCPILEVLDNKVLIGEEGNLCTLKPEEFEKLARLIKKKF